MKKLICFFGNKDHYSSQINRLDYFHFELIGYRKLARNFSLRLGLRQIESNKSLPSVLGCDLQKKISTHVFESVEPVFIVKFHRIKATFR